MGNTVYFSKFCASEISPFLRFVLLFISECHVEKVTIEALTDNQHMQSILLHACCAPCSAAVLEWLLKNNMAPTVFFFNPNIAPRTEYEKRKAELVRHSAFLNVPMIDGDYDHTTWLDAVKGLENEPERGHRCDVCFYLRLKEAARKSVELGIPVFTTTLASSRWKSLEQVNAAGFRAAQEEGVRYWDKNWRKDGLQERRGVLLKTYGFYNQTWCGCEFSKRDADMHRALRQIRESTSD